MTVSVLSTLPLLAHINPCHSPCKGYTVIMPFYRTDSQRGSVVYSRSEFGGHN